MTCDVNWLARIHAACFKVPRPWSADEIAELLASSGATLATDFHGFALARAALDEAEILTIAVMPTARRRGIGHALLRRLEIELSAKNTRYLYLEVSEANTAALALYYSCGYAESGRCSGYCGTTQTGAQDALILSKTLK